jgi:hypothetical protein
VTYPQHTLAMSLTEMTVSDRENPTPQPEIDAARATARLPGLDIEIVHRRSPSGDAEQIPINLQAVPSFDAFGLSLKKREHLPLSVVGCPMDGAGDGVKMGTSRSLSERYFPKHVHDSSAVVVIASVARRFMVISLRAVF